LATKGRKREPLALRKKGKSPSSGEGGGKEKAFSLTGKEKKRVAKLAPLLLGKKKSSRGFFLLSKWDKKKKEARKGESAVCRSGGAFNFRNGTEDVQGGGEKRERKPFQDAKRESVASSDSPGATREGEVTVDQREKEERNPSRWGKDQASRGEKGDSDPPFW